MPANSASPELNAMVFWVVNQCLMAREPRTRTPTQVDLWVRRHPAKSVSTCTRRVGPSSCHG
eukprot:10199870-Alexandrium_andersonii.AAC.1